MIDDEQLPASGELLDQLTRDRRAKVAQFSLGVEGSQFGARVWITNPYGLDVGFRDLTEAGCEDILAMIAEVVGNPMYEREWGSV